ncbi:MAG: hypothetical protein BWY75_02779 [bacterium ADurb.Bin425]|nr:MAG: hypothetical protein BWY75_02779 [bacterium ADurb.Bin425]
MGGCLFLCGFFVCVFLVGCALVFGFTARKGAVLEIDFVGAHICKHLGDRCHHFVLFSDEAAVQAELDRAKQEGNAGYD